MYQAITTKYLGPTNIRGARVKATASAGSVTLSWDHARNSEANHTIAAHTLASKLDWHGTWHGGAPAENIGGYVFVLETTDTRDSFIITKQQES